MNASIKINQLVLIIFGLSNFFVNGQNLTGKIVFSHQQSGNDWDLFLMNNDGSGQTALTANSFRDTNPYFNATGSKIVFGRITSTMPMAADIYIINADGTNETNLTNNSTISGPALSPKFSPEGTQIVFDVQNTPGNGDLYIMNPDGTGLTGLLTDANDDSSPHFSPDGQWVVFQRLISNNPNPKSKLCKVKISDKSVIELTAGNDLDEMPCWSPDGNYIVFKRGVSYTNICRISSTHLPSDEAGIVYLTNTTSYVNDAPRYSPEGDKIAFMSTHGYMKMDSMEIYVMNADGNNLQRITYNKVADFDPAFTPASNTSGNISIDYLTTKKQVKINPNPFSEQTNIRIKTNDSGKVTCRIYDIFGNQIYSITENQSESGSYSFNIDGSALPSGVYFYQIQYSDKKELYLNGKIIRL